MHYPNIALPDTEARIFFRMSGELARLGGLAHEHKVLCPFCLTWKSLEQLTLEHIIPKRALKHDPDRLKKLHFLSHRSGLTLLCKQCNALKGRHYDPIIEYLFRYPRPIKSQFSDAQVLKVRKILGYLAAFRELGYSYVLTNRALETIRAEFLNPQMQTTTTGVFFITACFERDRPHAYFEGWCDTYDSSGAQLASVFSCYDDLKSDNIQVRARHLTVCLPQGKRNIIVPKKPNDLGNIGLNLSII